VLLVGFWCLAYGFLEIFQVIGALFLSPTATTKWHAKVGELLELYYFFFLSFSSSSWIPYDADDGYTVLRMRLLQRKLSCWSVPSTGVDHVEFYHIPLAPCP